MPQLTLQQRLEILWDIDQDTATRNIRFQVEYHKILEDFQIDSRELNRYWVPYQASRMLGEEYSPGNFYSQKA